MEEELTRWLLILGEYLPDRGVVALIVLGIFLPTLWLKRRLADEAEDIGIRTLGLLAGTALAAAVATTVIFLLAAYLVLNLV